MKYINIHIYIYTYICQTPEILLFMGVQKIYGPEISRFLLYMLQFLDHSLTFFSNYKREVDHFMLDLLKRSDT